MRWPDFKWDDVIQCCRWYHFSPFYMWFFRRCDTCIKIFQKLLLNTQKLKDQGKISLSNSYKMSKYPKWHTTVHNNNSFFMQPSTFFHIMNVKHPKSIFENKYFIRFTTDSRFHLPDSYCYQFIAYCPTSKKGFCCDKTFFNLGQYDYVNNSLMIIIC